MDGEVSTRYEGCERSGWLSLEGLIGKQNVRYQRSESWKDGLSDMIFGILHSRSSLLEFAPDTFPFGDSVKAYR